LRNKEESRCGTRKRAAVEQGREPLRNKEESRCGTRKRAACGAHGVSFTASSTGQVSSSALVIA
jgi:hypothetical protein